MFYEDDISLPVVSRGESPIGFFFGIRDFHYLKLGIRELKEKSGRVLRLKVCTGGGMPKIILGITGFKNPIGDPPFPW